MEIRSYEGDAEDLAELMQRVWKGTYLRKMWFPLWDAEFLRWQLGNDDRRLCLAAYDAKELVGCFFSVRHSLRVASTVFPITFSSWCTVDPDYRSPRLGLEMIEALRRRHEETGQAFSLGVVSGDRGSLAFRFWSRYARASPENFRFLSKLGFWVKVLNSRAVSRAGVTVLERWGIRLMGPVLTRAPFAAQGGLRPYQPSDLESCAGLLERATRKLDWAVTWTPQELAHQLVGVAPHTLIFEKNGETCGMVNYHHLQFQGREPVCMAVIDLWATPGLNMLTTTRLLGSVCRQLQNDGVHAVMCLRSAMFPASALLANVFVPLPAKDHLVALFTRWGTPLAVPKTWSLLFR